MRLLNTGRTLASGDLVIESFVRPPPYAILSHTWTNEEVTLQDISLPGVRKLEGYFKILKTCELAAQENLSYAWIDTCCIDKTSSAELSEAINSMYNWYKQAAIAYAYLEDLQAGPISVLEERQLQGCRWFTRGWTLQELLAPVHLVFYDREWNVRGRRDDIADILQNITGIEEMWLNSDNKRPRYERVATVMSWAAGRQTTREEDIAYCLMGLFGVNMPLLYGEGKKAFIRLQEALITMRSDPTMFAWVADASSTDKYRGLFARCPEEFAGVGDLFWADELIHSTDEYNLTSKGIKITTGLSVQKGLVPQTVLGLKLFDLDESQKQYYIGIYLEKNAQEVYMRANPRQLARSTDEWVRSTPAQIFISKNTYGGNLYRHTCRTKICLPDIFNVGYFEPVSFEPKASWDAAHCEFQINEFPTYVTVITFVATPAAGEEFRGLMFFLICGANSKRNFWMTLETEITTPGITSFVRDTNVIRKLIGEQHQHRLTLKSTRRSTGRHLSVRIFSKPWENGYRFKTEVYLSCS